MATSILTHTRFLRYQERFYTELSNNPALKCTFVIMQAATTGAFTDFTGDSDRSADEFIIPCLFKRDFTPNERTKYGLRNNANLILWVSPKHLYHTLGTAIINTKTMKVQFEDDLYIIDAVKYQGKMYGSYINAEIQLISNKVGGRGA